MEKFIKSNYSEHHYWIFGKYIPSFWEYILFMNYDSYDTRKIDKLARGQFFQTNGKLIWIRNIPEYLKVIEEYNSLCEE